MNLLPDGHRRSGVMLEQAPKQIPPQSSVPKASSSGSMVENSELGDTRDPKQKQQKENQSRCIGKASSYLVNYTWHNIEKNDQCRKEMNHNILRMLRKDYDVSRKSKWLLRVVKTVETSLYNNSRSSDEYKDSSTLKPRVERTLECWRQKRPASYPPLNERRSKRHTRSYPLREIFNIMQHISLCRHAVKCARNDGMCTFGPPCAKTKRLWRHMEGCTYPNCRFPNCVWSRGLPELQHTCCEDPSCPQFLPRLRIADGITTSGNLTGPLMSETWLIATTKLIVDLPFRVPFQFNFRYERGKIMIGVVFGPISVPEIDFRVEYHSSRAHVQKLIAHGVAGGWFQPTACDRQDVHPMAGIVTGIIPYGATGDALRLSQRRSRDGIIPKRSDVYCYITLPFQSKMKRWFAVMFVFIDRRNGRLHHEAFTNFHVREQLSDRRYRLASRCKRID